MKKIGFAGAGWLLCWLVAAIGLEAACPPEAGILAAAYPEAVRIVEDTQAGCIFAFSNGQRVPFADGRALTPEQRLEDADLATVLSQPYPPGKIPLPAPIGREAGRWRNYPLLQAAYGATRGEVEANLDSVDFLGVPIRFNRKNGAAEALQQVARDIANDSWLMAFVKPIIVAGHAGKPDTVLDNDCVSGWNWRRIAGTDRLSPHAFGIALDINNPFAVKPKYWRWRKNGKTVSQLDPIPWPLIEVFEKHGFIWGGKWNHFDTMHFEFRPEFRLRRNSEQLNSPTAEH
jgi:hypothetical protein